MASIALLGASGYTGRLVARALDRRGRAFVAAGRNTERVRRAVDGLESVIDVRRADVEDDRTLARLCDGVDVVITTVGPFRRLGRPVLDAAIAAGCHYVDCSGEQPFVRWAFAERAREASDAGITAVPACGFDFAPGDVLAEVAAAELPEVEEVHVAYLVSPALRVSRGTRASIAGMLDARSIAFEDERLVEEQVAATRRLCWFPKPVGPRHGASVPGTEPLTVPRHVPDVRVVRTYMALPGVLAEAGQFAATLLRLDPVRSVAERVLTSGSDGPSERSRRKVRWAVVAEATSGVDPSTRPGDRGPIPLSEVTPVRDVARAWAYGRDIYATTAEILAAAAGRLADGRDRGVRGVVAPAEAFAAGDLLDELADAAGLRWSVARSRS